MTVSTTRTPYLHLDRRITFRDGIIRIDKSKYSIVPADDMTSLEWLTFPGFILVVPLGAADGALVERLIGCAGHEVVLRICEAFRTLCAER